MILYTLKLLSWFMVIAFRIRMDRKGRKYDSYLPVNIALGICSILHGILLDLEYRDDVLGRGYIPWSYLLLLSWQMTSYWLFFEGGLNIVRKRIKEQGSFWKGLLYFDTVEHDSGGIDLFFAKRPLWMHRVAKAMALIVMIITTVILLMR